MASIERTRLDQADLLILAQLVADSRISLRNLGELAKLSAPSVRERVRQMEDGGVITAFTAEIEWRHLGYGLQAIARVEPVPGKLKEVERLLRETPQVVQCDCVTGDDCFVIRLMLRDIADLDEVLGPLHAIAKTSTAMVKSTPVPLRAPPFPQPRT